MKKQLHRFNAKRVAWDGLFLALALIISLVESAIPPIVPALPYAKIGLGNVVLLACFLLAGKLDGYIVLVLRCLLNAVFSANTASLMWSLPSALFAYTIMIALFSCKIFSVCAVSVAGGIAHNFMQICVACAIIGKSVLAYLPYMMLAGAIAGFVTGILCYFIVKALGWRMQKKYDCQPYVRQLARESEEGRDDCVSENE
ncbi:MAG: Gx transporter family protein [Christensenellales bacterium]